MEYFLTKEISATVDFTIDAHPSAINPSRGTKWLLRDESVSEENDDDDAGRVAEVVSTTDSFEIWKL